MKKLGLLFMVLLLTACADWPYFGPPLPGINYRGDLPEADAHFVFADRFAAELSRRSGLPIVGSFESGKEDAALSFRQISLGKAGNFVPVGVMVYARQRQLDVEVEEKPSKAEAQRIAAIARQIWTEWFPDRSYVAFDRRRGILGP